jgi:hypothetical protein
MGFQEKLKQLEFSGLQAYSIKGTSKSQETALRELAGEYGFDDLRGFNKFLENARLNYYDLIKIASPE